MIGLSADTIAHVAAGELSGRASIRFERLVIDSREVRPGDLFVAISGDRHDGHRFIPDALARGARGVVARTAPLADARTCWVRVDDTTVALGRIAAHVRRQLPAMVVGITGSVGKTTTKELLAGILGGRCQVVKAPRSFNNHIGVPLTILAADASTDVIVAELGTNAPGEIDALSAILKPDLAIITAVAGVHLEGLGSIDAIRQEKAAIASHLKPEGVLIGNVDFAGVEAILAGHPGPRVAVRPREATAVAVRAAGTSFEFAGRPWRTRLVGAQQLGPVLLAIAAARALGWGDDAIASQLLTIAPVPGRMVARWMGGVMAVDDSYNANPTSMRAALEAFSGLPCRGRRYACLGDMRELGPDAVRYHQELGRVAAELPIAGLITLGELGRHIGRSFSAERDDAAAHLHAADEGAARAMLARLLMPGDAILFKGSRAMGLDRLVASLEEQRTGLRRRAG